MDFASRNDPGAVLDQYLDEEDLEKLIMKEETIFDSDLPWTSQIDAYVDFEKENIKDFGKKMKIVIYNVASDP